MARERQPIQVTLAEDMGFFRLLWSDYRAAMSSGGVIEPTLRAALLWLPRLLLHPALQFAFLVRLGQKGPGFLLYPIRWLQVVMFGCEVWWFRGPTAIKIGPGVVFPHPINVLIGPGTVIGENVMIYNNTNIGADRHYEVGEGEEDVANRAAHIGDGAIVYAYSVVQGPYNIGENAVCGLRVILDEDIPPGALKTQKAVRQAGEWPGARGARWRAYAEDRA